MHHGNAHLAIEIEGTPFTDPIGHIWQAEEASNAFEDGKLRSLSFVDAEGDDDISEDDDSEEKIDGDSQSDDSESSTGTDDSDDDNMAVVFRNETPATLLLCWVSEAGKPYHFYRLEPSTKIEAKKKKNSGEEEIFELWNTDHLETTHPGHAFCLGYVHGEEEIVQLQKSKSLYREAVIKTNKSHVGKMIDGNGNNKHADRSKSMNIVVAGYRPFNTKSPSSSSTASSSSSSSSSILSRRVQLVTISHVSQEATDLRRRPASQKKTNGRKMLPWFSNCWKRTILVDDIDNEDNSDGDGFHDAPLDPSGWRVSARWVRTKSKPYDTTNKFYEECTIGGWPCRVEPNWSNGDSISAEKLERDIHAASLLLPQHARVYLKSHCKIWINRSLKWGPKDCPVRGNGCCYHPCKKWLVRNGLSGDKHKSVEVNHAPEYREDCDLWGSGGIIIHELSHAYHHAMLLDGYENEEIQNCYDMAMKEGLYDSIEYHRDIRDDGKISKSTAKAYASTDAMEYFAELSAAFLGGLDDTKEYNKWYPYNRKQIKEHDPRAYELLSRLWKVDVNIAGKTTPTK